MLGTCPGCPAATPGRCGCVASWLAWCDSCIQYIVSLQRIIKAFTLTPGRGEAAKTKVSGMIWHPQKGQDSRHTARRQVDDYSVLLSLPGTRAAEASVTVYTTTGFTRYKTRLFRAQPLRRVLRIRAYFFCNRRSRSSKPES